MKWFLIFLCLPAFGQLPVLPFAPISASSVATPASIPGLKYWWVSSDLATNVAVTSWTDRLASAVMTNGSTSTRPTNSAQGIGFNGTTTLLTNTVLTAATPNPTNTAIAVIWKPIGFTPDGMTILFDLDQSLHYNFLSSQFGSGGVRWFTAKTAPNITDWVWGLTDNGGANNQEVWTNGVLAGIPNQTLSLPTHLTVFGNYQEGGNQSINGYVLEVAWFTNNISTNSAAIAAFHKYATNTYKFSP